MYKGAAFQIAHARRNLRGHVHKDYRVYVLAVACTQVVQQVATTHELRDDVEGRLPSANPEELHQIWMSHLLHNGRFLQEVFKCHCVVF